MLFNSFPFLLLFLPIVVAGYAVAQRILGQKAAQGFLLASSFFFYGCARPSYVPILAGSILFNWLIGTWMGKADEQTPANESRRKLILRIGLVGNVGLMCSFKYINFFLQHFAFLNASKFALPNWEFPLGISFFTLTQVMYLVDTYQGLNAPNSLFDHATAVSMFPYIEAGPLVRMRTIIPQLREYKKQVGRSELACRGIYMLSLGLAKKVVLADSFAQVANVGFGSAENFSTLESWIFSLCYTFQIYFDFSGYSDMAVGCAWMLGIDIPQNFNNPYISKSVSEFWQRWHISLSNFITNYLYTPILQSMGKATITTSVIAVMIAMSIAGLWHGPAWTYVIWGTLHGCALGVCQIWKRQKTKMPPWLAWGITFLFVDLSLVFFRSPSVPLALHMLHGMLPHEDLFGTEAIMYIIPMNMHILLRPVALGVLLAFFFKTSQQLAEKFRPSKVTVLATAALILVSFLFMNSTAAKEFVYFAF
jgi:D-alanyl-lipoteichoic acid acyltransferase DltB (MBOAT superfamily)